RLPGAGLLPWALLVAQVPRPHPPVLRRPLHRLPVTGVLRSRFAQAAALGFSLRLVLLDREIQRLGQQRTGLRRQLAAQVQDPALVVPAGELAQRVLPDRLRLVLRPRAAPVFRYQS